ncbi:MAG: VCBS repeat-containing protein, partial [Verrucomicrobiota bacterium]
HTHHDDPFDDFSRQLLLPNKLSQLGPGVTWFDVDGDGREDLIVGSGKGGLIGVYRNRGTNGFERLQEPVFAGPVTRDQTSILGWRSATNQTFLLAGCANYEDGLASGPAVRQYDFARKVVDDSLTTQESSTGPLALADVDGNGMLDLFVGGRVIPGRYPEAASSRIYRQNGHQWRVRGETSRILEKVGLVSGAVFSDLDGDGFAELILACEWGPIRIFRNERGKFVPWDLPVVFPGASSNHEQRTTLSQLTGWWNGVTTGDFDGDGRLDVAASNWGRNTKYQSHRTQPLTIYYGDFAGDGTVQLVEAHYEAALQKTVPERQLDDLDKGLPFLNETFSSHRAYSVASVAEVLGDRLKAAKTWQANWLESTVFLNRGDHFEVRVLPVEAQMAPVFGICVGDFDGEGNEDLFLSQNFFATQPETPRYDAGRSLWLRGDGRGGFSAVSGQESGVAVYGEGRGCALCDFDGDGRVDLAVAQNSAATRLYRNQTGRVGLRVRLEGPVGNPQGIGAVLRLKWGERFGAAREVHAGSGYWSQDSAVQVMATPEPPTQIWVRWPGGKIVTADIPAGAREISVELDGQVNLLR